MILVDANLLVYAHVAGTPHHRTARKWLDGELNGGSRVGLPWASLLAFVRLVSNPRVFARPLSVPQAWSQVEAWLEVETVWVPGPTERHAIVLASLMTEVNRAELVPDAHLAALAMEHGLTLFSADGDFARFRGLRWQNPLIAG